MMEDLFSLAVSFSKGGWSLLVSTAPSSCKKNIIICEVSKIPITTQPGLEVPWTVNLEHNKRDAILVVEFSILNFFSWLHNFNDRDFDFCRYS
ncbi:hypothetical protein CEXT_379991 [Caerostris extrusa]|uniref:Uncharacterized protein n=1 Tax=Caerostris extrusa TaxID=172846 RepID=A0AAV4N0K5_CAEEX|nr:hypothetical protein CEXT_379991 [Caerostris extrusa]